MSSEQLFANGRIAVLSTRLLSKDKYMRLAECNNLAEALRVLSEYGFGEVTPSPNDYEMLLHSETDKTLALLKELCTNTKTLCYLLCKYDYHNAKVLMKGKYMRRDFVSMCFEGASYSPEQMRDDFVADNYGSYPKRMSEACDAIDAAFANGDRSPQTVDKILDKACFAEMLSLAKGSLSQLVVKLCDLQINAVNLTTVRRFRRADFTSQTLDEWFVDGGSIKRKTLSGLLEGSILPSELPEQYRELLRNGDAFVAMRNRLVADYADPMTVQPVLEYFFAKLDEVDLVRRILVDVKNGADKDKLKDKINRCLTK